MRTRSMQAATRRNRLTSGVDPTKLPTRHHCKAIGPRHGPWG